jgi:hypothetical protein
MQCANLSDDELFQAIAANTNAISDLLLRRTELEDQITKTTDPITLSQLMDSYVGAVSSFESEYRTCTAELRRRSCVGENSSL